MSDAEKLTPERSEVQHYMQRCPHCREMIAVSFVARIDSVSEGTVKPRDWRDGLSATEVTLGEELERSGAAAACVAVAEFVTGSRPVRPTRYLLAYLQRALPAKMDGESRAIIRGAFGTCDVFDSQGVGMIVKKERIVAFVPLVKAKGIKNAGVAATSSPLAEWIRNKHGYVAGGGVFLQAMTQRSVGDFARLVQ